MSPKLDTFYVIQSLWFELWSRTPAVLQLCGHRNQVQPEKRFNLNKIGQPDQAIHELFVINKISEKSKCFFKNLL